MSNTGEYLSRVGNTLFNPFEWEKLALPPDMSPAQKQLAHAAALGVGYAGLGYAVRTLVHAARAADQRKTMGNVRESVNARYPVWSPSKQDTPQTEEDERNLGARPEEELQELPNLKEGADSGFSIFPNLSWLVDDKQPTSHVAIAGAGAVLGGLTGWQLANYVVSRKRRADLNKKLSEEQAAGDQEIATEYRRTRGIEEEPMSAKEASEICETFMKVAVQAVEPDPLHDPKLQNKPGIVGKASQGLQTAYWLYALSTMALAYKGMRAYTDSKDPNRIRLKEIQELAAERAKSSNAPVFMDEASLPETPVQKRLTRTRAPVPDMGTIPLPATGSTTVDSTDPFAGKLAV